MGSESTLRLKTESEYQGLDAWIARIRQARQEVEALTAAAAGLSGSTGNAGAGGAGSAHGTPPPAAPPTSAAAGAPASAPSAAAPTAAAATGGSPFQPPGSGYDLKSYRLNKKGEVTSQLWAQGKPPPDPPPAVTREGGGFLDGVAGFGKRVASTAVGMALGSSVQGFLFQSAETYMRLSTVIAQLDARFKSAGASAHSFGAELGYTIAQSGQIATAYGSSLNTFDKGRASTFAGFARTTGMDPSQTMGALGGIFRTRPSQDVSDTSRLMRILGAANQSGMGQGRLPEYLEQFAAVQQMMQSTGAGSGDANVAGMMGLAGRVFGPNDERGRSGAASFAGGLQSMGRTRPMQAFLLRQMGFGQAGGPTYMQAMVQADRGLLDPGNLQLLTKGFARMGVGNNSEAIFKALNPLRGGMSVDTIAQFSQMLASPEKRAGFFASLGSGGTMDRESAFFKGLSPEQRKAFEAGGFVGAGKTAVSQGEAMAVRLEAMQMSVGKTMAQTIDDMRGIAQDVIKSIRNLVGDDLGKMLHEYLQTAHDLTGALVTLTAAINGGTGGGVTGMAGSFGADVAGSWAIAAKQGPVAALRYGLSSLSVIPGGDTLPFALQLHNMAIEAARSGPEGAYSQALNAAIHGKGPWPTSSPYEKGSAGSEGP